MINLPTIMLAFIINLTAVCVTTLHKLIPIKHSGEVSITLICKLASGCRICSFSARLTNSYITAFWISLIVTNRVYILGLRTISRALRVAI